MNKNTTINSITMVGRLTQDPDLKTAKTGKPYCRLNIATEYEGRTKRESCFIDVTVWDQDAEMAKKYLKKGSVIAVIGRLSLQRWQDKATGANREKHVIEADTVTYLERIHKDMK